jgi:hypothetical protein
MLVPSVSTQFRWSLTPHWLSWWGVSLRVDSVDVESTQSDEFFEYLGEFDFIHVFETNLGYVSGDQMGAFDGKKTEVKNLVQV